MTCQGTFGQIDVVDRPDQRLLVMNNQIQGAAFLSPGAEFVDPQLSGPGPISSSAYALGWLAAGHCAPAAQALMIGLGSGAGACQLLWMFPWIELTIIEACPEVERVARESFPLINHYSREGRLRVIRGYAQEVLSRSTAEWDIGLADAYTGQSEATDINYLDELIDRCADVWLNVIDVPDGRHLAQTADRLAAADRPAAGYFRAVDILRASRTYMGPANWIVTTVDPPLAQLEAWRPFGGIPGQGGNWGRLNWEPFVHSWQPLALGDHHLLQL